MDTTQELRLCRTCAHYEREVAGSACDTCLYSSDNKPFWEARPDTAVSNDGSTADYYVLPEGATQLQDLISFRNMNAQLGEIQRAVYRYGQGHHSSRERDLKKIIFYAQAELDRLEKYE